MEHFIYSITDANDLPTAERMIAEIEYGNPEIHLGKLKRILKSLLASGGSVEYKIRFADDGWSGEVAVPEADCPSDGDIQFLRKKGYHVSVTHGEYDYCGKYTNIKISTR
jgi:hypothetical protein